MVGLTEFFFFNKDVNNNNKTKINQQTPVLSHSSFAPVFFQTTWLAQVSDCHEGGQDQANT